MGVSENEDTPTSAVGAHWLSLGLGLILVLLVAIKKTLKWFKKVKTLCLSFLLVVEKYFLFQKVSKRKQ